MSAPRNGGSRLLARSSTAVFLLLVWVGVSGSFTTASFVGGSIVVALVMVLFPEVGQGGSGHRVRPVMLARYVGYYVRELVRANVHVAQAVIRPASVEHRRGIIEVTLPPSSRLVTAILANAVSLTPGTSIIEVSERPSVFHVHVLELDDVDVVRCSIAELHWRLVRAIGPADRLDGVARALEELRARVGEGS